MVGCGYPREWRWRISKRRGINRLFQGLCPFSTASQHTLSSFSFSSLPSRSFILWFFAHAHTHPHTHTPTHTPLHTSTPPYTQVFKHDLWQYIEHPPIQDHGNAVTADLPLMLTKKELKKLRRTRRIFCECICPASKGKEER